MTSRDRQLDQLFASLPKERAGEDFTRNVLSELSRRRARLLPGPKVALVAVLATGLVAALVSVLWHVTGEMQRARLQQELIAVRAEYQEITRQLEELDRAAQESAVLYIGSDDQVDYVLDLDGLRSRLGESTEPAICPSDRGVAGPRSAWPSREALPVVYQGGPI